MTWRTEEAWLFLSIGDAGGGKPATLDLVIGAADGNNHAIPTQGEVEKAISHLLGAGLIDVNDDKFSLTSAGQEIFQRENAVAGRGHITRFLELADKWRITPPSHADPIPWRLNLASWRPRTLPTISGLRTGSRNIVKIESSERG
jgi:hypothetical protein